MRWPAVAALAATCLVGGCKQELNFTRVPFVGALETPARASETTVFTAVPLDLAAVQAIAADLLATDIPRSREFIDDIACGKRRGPWVECIGATVTTELKPVGAVEVTATNGKLTLVVPLAYDIAAKGHGWAGHLTDHKTGTVEVAIPFEATLATGYRLDVKVGNDLVWSQRSVAVLKGKVSLPTRGDAKLKARLAGIVEPIRKALAEQPMREATGKAWRALHTPIELTRGPSLWLRGQPERVVAGGFATLDDRIVYRIGIGTRVTVSRGDRPAPLFTKPLPEPTRLLSEPGRAGDTPLQTVLHLPLDIPAASLNLAIAQAFPPTDIIETRAEPRAAPVKVRPAAALLFPSRDKLALELQLDVVEPSRLLGMTGRAYLLGRPVLNVEAGVIELVDIAFPPSPPKDPRSKEPKEPQLRIGEEPFAGRLAAAARLNVGGEIRNLLPRINAFLNQPLGDDQLELSGQFETLNIASIEPARDAFRLNLELTGQLALRFARPATAASRLLQHTTAPAAPPKAAVEMR